MNDENTKKHLMSSKKKKLLLALLIVISAFLIFVLSMIIYAAHYMRAMHSGCGEIYFLTDKELVPLIEQSIAGDSNATQRIAAYYTECTNKTNVARYWRTVLSVQNPEDPFLIQYNKRMDNYRKMIMEIMGKLAEEESFDREEHSK